MFVCMVANFCSPLNTTHNYVWWLKQSLGQSLRSHLILNTIPAYMILWPLLDKMAKARHANEIVQLNVNNTPAICVLVNVYICMYASI
jgi:hypothetical protein